MPPKSKRTATKSRGTGLAGRSSARPSRGVRGGDQSSATTRNLIASKINAFVNDPNNPLNNPAYMYGQGDDDDNDNDNTATTFRGLGKVNLQVEKIAADKKKRWALMRMFTDTTKYFTTKGTVDAAVVAPAIAAAVIKTSKEDPDAVATASESATAAPERTWREFIFGGRNNIDEATAKEIETVAEQIIAESNGAPVELDESASRLLEAVQENEKDRMMSSDELRARALTMFPQTDNAQNAANQILNKMTDLEIRNFFEIMEYYVPFMKNDDGTDAFDEDVNQGASITKHLSFLHQFINNPNPRVKKELEKRLKVKENRAALYLMLHKAIARNSSFEEYIVSDYNANKVDAQAFQGNSPYAKDFAFDVNNKMMMYTDKTKVRSKDLKKEFTDPMYRALNRKIFLDALNANSPDDDIITLFQKFLNTTIRNYENTDKDEPFFRRFQRRVAGL